MYQVVLLCLCALFVYYWFQSVRGWNGTIRELPAYNLSLIRTSLRQRRAVVIRNALTEDAKQEYDEIYE